MVAWCYHMLIALGHGKPRLELFLGTKQAQMLTPPPPGGAAPSCLKLLSSLLPQLGAVVGKGTRCCSPAGRGFMRRRELQVWLSAPRLSHLPAHQAAGASRHTYRIKRLGSQELLKLLELLLVLVQDVPLLLGQGTHAARGAGQGRSVPPVLVLHP